MELQPVASDSPKDRDLVQIWGEIQQHLTGFMAEKLKKEKIIFDKPDSDEVNAFEGISENEKFEFLCSQIILRAFREKYKAYRGDRVQLNRLYETNSEILFKEIFGTGDCLEVVRQYQVIDPMCRVVHEKVINLGKPEQPLN